MVKQIFIVNGEKIKLFVTKYENEKKFIAIQPMFREIKPEEDMNNLPFLETSIEDYQDLYPTLEKKFMTQIDKDKNIMLENLTKELDSLRTNLALCIAEKEHLKQEISNKDIEINRLSTKEDLSISKCSDCKKIQDKFLEIAKKEGYLDGKMEMINKMESKHINL